MSTYNKVIIQNAEKEIEYVFDYLKELSSVNDTSKLWRAWSGLLDHYHKAVSALRHATDHGKSKQWSDRLLHDQKADPLLNYAFQARNHENHGFETEREANPRFVSFGGIISVSGDSSITLSNNTIVGSDGKKHKLPEGHLITSGGRYAGGSIPKSSIEENEHHVVLSDVKVRGVVYLVPNPKTHPSLQALEISQHVANWLKCKLSEVHELLNRYS